MVTDDQARASVRADIFDAMIAAGVPAVDANVVVDLAMFATDQAMDVFTTVCDCAGPLYGSVTHLALQLVRTRCETALEDVQSLLLQQKGVITAVVGRG